VVARVAGPICAQARLELTDTVDDRVTNPKFSINKFILTETIFGCELYIDIRAEAPFVYVNSQLLPSVRLVCSEEIETGWQSVIAKSERTNDSSCRSRMFPSR
jgi:hypothetical protein